MTDPFSIQTREGMDAPDLQVRTAQLKVQSGQPLRGDELRRLAVRQGLEAEANRQNQERIASGFAPINPVRVSVAQGLAGTGLDPVLAGARVQAARLATDPVERAKFEQAQELASFGLQATPGTPEAADALVNAKVRANAALQSGLPLEQVDQARLVGTVPVAEPVLADAVVEPVAVPQVEPVLAPVAEPAAAPLSPAQRVAAAIPKDYEPNVTNPNEVVDKEFSRRYAGQRMSVGQLREAKAQIRKELAPVRQTRSITDPLTRDTYEVEVLTDSLGNVYQRGEPVFKTAGPNKKLDEEFQKDMIEWTTGDGSAATSANIERLRSAIEILEDPSTVLASGRFAGLIGATGRKLLSSSRTASAQASVESATVEALRRILGAQFTENEGKRILALTFDPLMPEEENARRAKVLVRGLERAVDTKNKAAEYFRQNGTIQGFVGPASVSSSSIADEIVDTTPAKLAPVQSAKDAYISQFKQ